MKGNISAESEMGKGSEFIIYIPIDETKLLKEDENNESKKEILTDELNILLL